MRGEIIAAIATPPGRGGVGIIRLSGPQLAPLVEQLLGQLPTPRYALLSDFCTADGQLIDQGLALYFPTPHSFTGEDVLELHGHGGPVVLDRLLSRCLELGARLARPGEFSERAFLNGKLDLAQAEAVADLIDASTQAAAQAAVQSLQGEFSRQIQALVEELIELRIFVEAAIDFPEEEIDFLGDGQIAERLTQVQQQLQRVRASARQGQLLRDGMSVVIAGPPNAGKSSLLNALAGTDTAIVTAIAGTTRDVLRERIQIDGMPLHIIDTAGLRDTQDVVEQEGIRRAWAEMQRADRVLLVSAPEQPANPDWLQQLPSSVGVTRIHNKIDLSGQSVELQEHADGSADLYLSARNGAGITLLRQHLKRCMGYVDSEAGLFSARRRHLDALERAHTHLADAESQLTARAGELLAEELRLAQQALSEITGEFTADDLLGRIFSSFCIGK